MTACVDSVREFHTGIPRAAQTSNIVTRFWFSGRQVNFWGGGDDFEIKILHGNCKKQNSYSATFSLYASVFLRIQIKLKKSYSSMAHPLINRVTKWFIVGSAVFYDGFSGEKEDNPF